MARPLEGVRILDLTRRLPRAYATLLLADLGADVIKLEDPRGGDHARRMPPLADGTSVYFQVLNRNKRSVTLDLRSGEAGPVLDALLSTCDVMVDSFRPRTAVRVGRDLDSRSGALVDAVSRRAGAGGGRARRSRGGAADRRGGLLHRLRHGRRSIPRARRAGTEVLDRVLRSNRPARSRVAAGGARGRPGARAGRSPRGDAHPHA